MSEEPIAGRYRLLEPLGRGAMSAVWLAHDDELDRDVAVKTLAPTADRERFEREARAAAALSHPNICAALRLRRTDERRRTWCSSTSRTARSRTCSGSARRSQTTRRRRIALEIAAGLAHAHERGLVHRDLKPANILFDSESRAKIADFGIARHRRDRHADGGRHRPRHGVVHLTGAGIGRACRPAKRRLLVRRHPLPDAHGRVAVRIAERDGARPHAPRRAAARRPHAAAGRAGRARVADDVGARQGPGGAPARRTCAPRVAARRRHADDVGLRRCACGGRRGDEATRVLRPARSSRRPVVLAAVVAAALLLGGVVLAVLLTGGNAKPSPPPHVPMIPASTQQTTAAPTTTAPAATVTTVPATSTSPTTTAETTTAPTTTAETTTAPTTTVEQTTHVRDDDRAAGDDDATAETTTTRDDDSGADDHRRNDDGSVNDALGNDVRRRAARGRPRGRRHRLRPARRRRWIVRRRRVRLGRRHDRGRRRGRRRRAVGAEVAVVPCMMLFQIGYLFGVGKSSTLWCQSAAAMYSCQIGTGNVAPATASPCTSSIGISPVG